jgi:lipoprotein-anchoring transpeptidase ErfK/SrfK
VRVAVTTGRTLILALLILLPSVAFGESNDITSLPSTPGGGDCAFWDTRRECLGREGWPNDTPAERIVLTVDTATNRAYLFRDGELVRADKAATGMDKTLRSGDRTWLFRTPRGRHRVLSKIVDPIWYKPDWAFVEEKKPIPPQNSPKRLQKGKLGKYALDLGDGILVHGTDDPKSLGRKASHGCIRLGDRMMEEVFKASSVGMLVYVY